VDALEPRHRAPAGVTAQCPNRLNAPVAWSAAS
jgi:hypothetical protein